MSNRGTVSKRGDSWEYRVSFTDHSGVRQFRRKAFPTQKSAQKALTEFLGQLDSGIQLGSDRQTVADYLEAWIDTYSKTADVKPGTIRQHRINIDTYLKPRIGNLKLSELKPARVARLVAELSSTVGTKSKKGIGPKTVRNVLGTLSKALNDAVKHQVIVRNPCVGIDRPRWERPELRPWDAQQIARFVAYCETNRVPNAALFRLALLHGLRRGELAGLRWIDVDFHKAEITIAQTRVLVGSDQVTQSPKSKAGRRTISIDPGTLSALGRLRDQQNELARELGSASFALVATEPTGEPTHPDALLRRFRALSADAGLPVTRLHDARHAAATMMLTIGSPIQTVSAHLGHSKPSITLDVYGHALPKADRLTADATGAMIDSLIVDTLGHDLDTVRAEQG